MKKPNKRRPDRTRYRPSLKLWLGEPTCMERYRNGRLLGYEWLRVSSCGRIVFYG